MVKNEVLKIFLQNQNEIITGGNLAKNLNVSRNAVWKSINALKKQGYDIESIKNVGYRLNISNDLIEETLIRKNLKTKVLGKKIEIFKTIDSTNTYLKKGSFINGAVVVANHQSKGRGRRGRVFISNENKGIYMSFILNHSIDIEKISLITISVAVAVSRALKKICNVDVDLKWINDIFYNKKKLGGILTEGVISIEENKLTKLIIGIGLNTNIVSEEIENIAISIEDIIKNKNYKNDLISEILNSFEEIFFNNLLEDNMEEILGEYKKKLFVIGQKVDVIGSEIYEAKVLDINKKGELIVEDKKGNINILNSGEISIKFGG